MNVTVLLSQISIVRSVLIAVFPQVRPPYWLGKLLTECGSEDNFFTALALFLLRTRGGSTRE